MDIYTELAKYGTLIAATWSAAWFLNSKNNGTRALIYSKFEEVKNTVLSKLEYHEQHDDKRFEDIRRDLWEIRLSNAARTGKVNGNGSTRS